MQVFAKPAARGLQVPYLRDLEASAKPLGRRLQRALHNDQLIVFQHIAVGVVCGLVYRSFKRVGFIVKLEDHHLASGAVDNA